MKVRFLSVLSLAALLCVTGSVVAQPPQGGRGGRGGAQGGGGPGGMFGGGMFGGGMMGGGMSGAGATELLTLLRDEKVREEVEVSEDVMKAIQEAQAPLREKMRGLRDMSEQERTALMKEMGDSAQDLMDEVLTPAQQKRLMGLLVQQNGVRSVMNSLVAKQIGLDEKGTKKVQDALQAFGEEMREKMTKVRESGDFSTMREQMGSMREDMEKKLGEALTKDQAKALEELKGEKFEFSENQRGGRGGFGGGQGGGPGGAGGRPGRGGQSRGGNDR